MKAWVTHGYDDLRLEDVEPPVPRDGWAVVKVRVVQPAITEVQLLKGERTSGSDLVAQRLKEGPQQLFGHEFCGEVVALSDADRGSLSVGDRVTALHSRHGTIGRHFPGCFAELAAIPIDALVTIPEALDDWSAAALQPLSSCVRMIGDVDVGFDTTVLVLGQGVMGLNCAQVAKAAGARRVIGVDRRAELLDVSQSLGVDDTIDASTEDLRKRVDELTGGRGADLVVEAASGSPTVGLSGGDTVSDALDCVAVGGTVLSLAHFDRPVTLDFNLCRRKRVRYQFPPNGADQHDLRTAAELVAVGRVQLAPMITHRLQGLDSIPEAIEITANKSAYGALNPAQVRIA
jgi:threonine dehydrogenase-like Zn-dependent dehydrogenase